MMLSETDRWPEFDLALIVLTRIKKHTGIVFSSDFDDDCAL